MPHHDDDAPGDDGRYLGGLTAAIIRECQALGSAPTERLVRRVAHQLDAPGRSTRDRDRAAALALEVLRDLEPARTLDLGLQALVAAGARWRARRDS